jgi:two-component system phosphate regulon sensor histidine kinase PhoR
MKNPLRNITIALAVVALMPAAFLVFQVMQLNENEQMVRETYRNQLDAILYSVNQYSDDVVSDWANRVRLEAAKGPWHTDTTTRFMNAVIQTSVVKHIYFSDTTGNSMVVGLGDNKMPAQMKEKLDGLVTKERERMKRLIQYERAGFRKMESVNFSFEDNSVPVFFALGDQAPYPLAALVIDLGSFIPSTLAPKMQAISQGEFIISALRSRDDSVIYSTEVLTAAADIQKASKVFKDEISKRNFWVLQGYYLGISLKGATIDDLVRERTRTSLLIFGSFLIILIGGVVFLYRNVRKEMQLSQAKSEFVSNVSHEIRTPLSLIGMFAETLEAGRVTTEEKKKEYYHIIGKETARLSRIVNRILNFSQLEANRKRFMMAPVQLNDLCREILGTYADHFKEKNFEVSFQEGALPVVALDREAASEAIINLIDNAMKYSLDRKNIRVTTSTEGNFCVVAVADQGIGIAKTHHHAIFDQFFRAPSGDVHTTKGSGLGLTLVKKIMHAHRGDVTVESITGKGSTFKLLFPITKEA